MRLHPPGWNLYGGTLFMGLAVEKKKNRRRTLPIVMLALLMVAIGCRKAKLPSGFVPIRADRQLIGQSAYPLAIEPTKVGTYPPETKSGAGYLYDDVLEYRVWLHPESGAAALNGSKDYFVAFAQYERAKVFSDTTPGAEVPLALIRQVEWVDEPEPGHFIPQKAERITEWKAEWLEGNKRSDPSIEDFLKHPREARE